MKLPGGPLIENNVGSFLVLKLETKWRLFECFEVKQKTMFNTLTLLKKNLPKQHSNSYLGTSNNGKDGVCLNVTAKSGETLYRQTPCFPLYAPIKWKRRSLFKSHPQVRGNTLQTDSLFSTLWPHKVEKTESV